MYMYVCTYRYDIALKCEENCSKYIHLDIYIHKIYVCSYTYIYSEITCTYIVHRKIGRPFSTVSLGVLIT